MNPEIVTKDIPGYEGSYTINSNGEVYSNLSKKFLAKSDDTYGYHTVNLQTNNKSKTFKVHRLVASTFLENPNNHPHIDHSNRDRKDNRISNLKYASYSENARNKGPVVKKAPGLTNIQVKKTTFKVTINDKDNVRINKTFKTLQEAQDFRDNINQAKMMPLPERQVVPLTVHHH
tara:strand:+ start:192 stop:716 length:525 start_codon:yes stop_codon:yes gene_type:complete